MAKDKDIIEVSILIFSKTLYSYLISIQLAKTLQNGLKDI